MRITQGALCASGGAVARLNITLPDPLYERLKRLEDRVNASKVCSVALERELDMIEARPETTDPDIQRAIDRLQSAADRWRDRGRRDGRCWAIEEATRDELRELDNSSTITWPKSFNRESAIADWIKQDTEAEMKRWDESHLYADGAESGDNLGSVAQAARLADRFHAQRAARKRVEEKVDRGSYGSGWFAAVRDVWKAVAPALN
jgi:hypothetical protein